MSCDAYRESLLDFDWDEATRQRAAALLNHLASCPDCQAAVRDFDRLRKSLAAPESDGEPVDGWTQFEGRLTASALPRQFRWRLPFLAFAASLLIAAIAFHLGRTFLPLSPLSIVTTESNPLPTSLAASFLPQKILYDVRAFDQVSKCFDGHASWMLVSDDASDVGTTADTLHGSRKVLLLRLTLTHGPTVASDADLLVIPGQTANLNVPIKGGESLHYRIGTSADEPTRLSLWLEVQTPLGGQPIAALSTHLQLVSGQRITAGQFATSAGAYELKIAFAREDLPADKS